MGNKQTKSNANTQALLLNTAPTPKYKADIAPSRQILVQGYIKQIHDSSPMDITDTILLFYAKPMPMKVQIYKGDLAYSRMQTILYCPIEDSYDTIITKIDEALSISVPNAILSVTYSPTSEKLTYYNMSTFQWDPDKLFIVNMTNFDNWTSQVHPQSGKTYYYDMVTLETTWTPPRGWLEYKQKNPRDFANQSKDPSNWVAVTDPATEMTYYANTITRETSWTKPDALKQDKEKNENEKEESDLKNWKATKDAVTGKVYYYNVMTHDTRWDPPKGWIEFISGMEENEK